MYKPAVLSTTHHNATLGLGVHAVPGCCGCFGSFVVCVQYAYPTDNLVSWCPAGTQLNSFPGHELRLVRVCVCVVRFVQRRTLPRNCSFQYPLWEGVLTARAIVLQASTVLIGIPHLPLMPATTPPTALGCMSRFSAAAARLPIPWRSEPQEPTLFS